MQQKIRSPETFLERTNSVAEAQGISIRQLAKVLDVSTASLFGYRSGKIPVSEKAWSKLERLEESIRPLKNQSLKVAEEVVSYLGPDLKTGNVSNDDFLDLIEAIVDVAPADSLIACLATFSERIVEGDLDAVRRAGRLAGLIRERRPEIFKTHKPSNN